MPDPRLATFRIDGDRWQEFQRKAALDSTNASDLLRHFIDRYLAGDLNAPMALSSADLDQRLETLANSLEAKIQRLDERLAQAESIIQDRQAIAQTPVETNKPPKPRAPSQVNAPTDGDGLGLSARALAAVLGCHHSTLGDWVKRSPDTLASETRSRDPEHRGWEKRADGNFYPITERLGQAIACRAPDKPDKSSKP